MARVNIYVSDDTKARMDEIGDNVNWSNVAQAAFATAIEQQQFRKVETMSDAIERLRKSKERYSQEQTDTGRLHGKEWAMEYAEYEQLKRVAQFSNPSLEITVGDLVYAAECEADELFGDTEVTDYMAQGFAAGAAEVLNEVEEHL